jgi:release factor glutamine methyltransferase
VERALARIDGVEGPRVLDVGTGTGAIALAIKQERSDAQVTATDISTEALDLARENAGDLDVRFVHADLIAGIDGTFDLVVSNPPYVLAEELESLQPELGWEPRGALVDEGQTERLARDARAVLDGWLVLEVHEGRAALMSDVIARLDYEHVEVTADLAGRPRVVEARWARTQSSRP